MSHSDTFNTIAMGVLSAALFAFGGKTFLDIAARDQTPEKPGYQLPVSKGGGGTVVAEKKFDFVKVATLLPKANASAGEDTFKKCATCHNDAKGADKKVGPNLWDLVGRPVGKQAGFEYSEAMKGHGGNWSWDRLATYLHDPRETVPGNKMSFAGIGEDQELADLLVYLNQHADTPQPLPIVQASAPGTPVAAPAAPVAAPAK